MKKGDSIIAIKNIKNELTEGVQYKIASLSERLCGVEVLNDNGNFCVYSKGIFKLVDETDEFKPNKSYLRKHKDEYVFIRRQFESEPITNLFWDMFNEDLTTKENLKHCDVMKIYRLTLVWERDERPEMTIEETQEKFKFRVKEEK